MVLKKSVTVCCFGLHHLREDKFDETARQLRVPCTKELVLDCKTHWNSTDLMLSTALVYKDVFSRLKQRDSSYTSLPNERD
jgi:hypothetical protein